MNKANSSVEVVFSNQKGELSRVVISGRTKIDDVVKERESAGDVVVTITNGEEAKSLVETQTRGLETLTPFFRR